MLRLAPRLIAAIAICGAVLYLLPDYQAFVRLGALTPVGLLTGALLISMAAVVVAVLAWFKARAAHREMARVVRSIDASLRAYRHRDGREGVSVEEMNEAIARKLATLAPSPTPGPARQPQEAGPQPAPPLPEGGNVVPHPAAMRPRPIQEKPAPSPVSAGTLDDEVGDAIARGKVDISLQPIVSVSRGAAAGFDVFAHFPSAPDETVDLRRLPASATAGERAFFERMLVEAAAEAGRRRLGGNSAGMSLLVPVSDALLANESAFENILDLYALYPPLAEWLVLAMPAEILSQGAPLRPRIAQLRALGVRLAAEDWRIGNADARDMPKGISYLTIAARLLLGDEETAQDRVRVEAVVEAVVEAAQARDVQIVASGVASDEQAVGLLDLGIDLMSGPRFSGPRRLKPETEADGERSALQ